MILVTGATGNVGSELVRQLIDARQPVRALVRERKEAIGPEIEVAVGDLDRPESLRPALQNVTSMFLLGGYRDMPGILEQARRAGVNHVVLLTSRSVIGGDPTNAIVNMWMVSEEAVRSSGLDWTILQPSGFMSNALRWIPQLRTGDVIRGPFANAPIACIDPADLAAVAARALTEAGHESKSYPLTGPDALVPADMVRVLASLLGRPLRFEPQPDDEARAEMSASMHPSTVDAFFRFYARGELDDSPVLPTVQQVTGHVPRTFTQWASAHADRFR